MAEKIIKRVGEYKQVSEFANENVKLMDRCPSCTCKKGVK